MYSFRPILNAGRVPQLARKGRLKTINKWSLQRNTTTSSSLDLSRNNTLRERPRLARFLNPWFDLAYLTPEQELGQKVILFAQSWSIVSVLLCGVSSASLMTTPHCLHDDKSKDKPVVDCYGILSENYLHDAYVLACATSFYTSGCALGLCICSTCLAMVTPCSSMPSFVASHSYVLCATPLLNAISGGLQGLAVAIGIDMTQGGHVAIMAYGAAGLTVVIVCSVALSGQLTLYRAITHASSLKKTALH